MLRDAMTKLLRPLVRLLLQHGVQYRELTEVIKRVYFDVGLAQLKKTNAKTSSSQLAVLTGLHRKDIAEFMAQDENAPIAETPNAGAAIIADWLTRKSYQDASGKPKVLPYSLEGRGVSFSTLVESVSKDMRPRVYLEEFIRLGLVRQDEDGLLYLQGDAFVPKEDFRAKVDFLVRNLGDHFSASSANMASNKPEHFDRSAFHGSLTPEAVAELRAFVDKEGMTLLKEFYRRAEAQGAHSSKSDKPAQRVTLGVYLYSEDET